MEPTNPVQILDQVGFYLELITLCKAYIIVFFLQFLLKSREN